MGNQVTVENINAYSILGGFEPRALLNFSSDGEAALEVNGIA